MSYGTIGITPVTPRIGAYVEGITLAKPLSNRQVEELYQGFHGARGAVFPRSTARRGIP